MSVARINKQSEVVLYWLTAATTLGFILFVLLGVITRYLTRAPILSTIELSRLFFVWSCFLAATLAYRRQAHIAISFITDKFPASLRFWSEFAVQSFTILFFLVILFESIRVVVLLWFTHLPVSGISQSWLYMPVPLASLVIILFTAESIINGFTRFKSL